MSKRHEIAVAILATIVVISACGGGEPEGGTDAGEAERGESLQDFIPGGDIFGPDSGPEDFRQAELEIQQDIAECMAAEGFEYVPYVPNFDEIGFGGDISQEEFIEEYGLGITRDLLEQHNFEGDELPPEIADDPNYAIREAMPEEEGMAYDAALHGEQPDLDFENMTEEEIDAFFSDFQPGGCYNDSYEQAYNNEASMDFYEEFGEKIDAMYQAAQADSRIADLEANWSECMAESGYDFQEENDAHIFILRRLEEVGVVSDLDIDPDGMGYGYSSEGAPEEGSPEHTAALAILEEEKAIARASQACRGDTEGVFQEVFAEYEQRFIEENRQALEEFRDR